MINLFIELLQVTLGIRECLSRVPSMREWNGIFLEAQRQAIAGVFMIGIEKLPDEQRPSKVLLLQWIAACQQIEVQNIITTKTSIKVCDRLDKDGFYTCVLKGQSNYRYYPTEMLMRRCCGDVDVWVVPKDENCKTPVKHVLEYVDAQWERTGLCWLHCNFTDKSGIPVEIHFHPSFMSEPCSNRRFQKHFKDISAYRTFTCIDNAEIPCLDVDEDVVYQMNHIYRHLIDEGVGLRQIVDYYYLLKTWNDQHTRSKEDAMRIVKRVGMKRFAGALMYVLREVCGMSEDLLLCPASVNDGQFLMSEILVSGNFGHNDPRMENISTSRGYMGMRLGQAMRRFKRNLRFFTSYSGEVIWEPIVRVEHFVWKKLKMWRFE